MQTGFRTEPLVRANINYNMFARKYLLFIYDNTGLSAIQGKWSAYGQKVGSALRKNRACDIQKLFPRREKILSRRENSFCAGSNKFLLSGRATFLQRQDTFLLNDKTSVYQRRCKCPFGRESVCSATLCRIITHRIITLLQKSRKRW